MTDSTNDSTNGNTNVGLMTHFPKGRSRVCTEVELDDLTTKGWVLVASYTVQTWSLARESELPPPDPNNSYNNQYRAMQDARTRAMPTTELRFVLSLDSDSALALAMEDARARTDQIDRLNRAAQKHAIEQEAAEHTIKEKAAAIADYQTRAERDTRLRAAADAAARAAEAGLAAEREKVQKLTAALGTVAAKKILDTPATDG